MSSAMPDLDRLRERLVGMKIGGLPVLVPPHEGVIGHRALGYAAAHQPTLHPVWATLLTLRGMEISFDHLFELAEGSAEDGIYFGEAAVDIHDDLEVGTTYTVGGEITDLVRRHGKTAGTFDVLSFRLDLRTPDSGIAATASNSFIFVRKGDA